MAAAVCTRHTQHNLITHTHTHTQPPTCHASLSPSVRPRAPLDSRALHVISSSFVLVMTAIATLPYHCHVPGHTTPHFTSHITIPRFHFCFIFIFVFPLCHLLLFYASICCFMIPVLPPLPPPTALHSTIATHSPAPLSLPSASLYMVHSVTFFTTITIDT